MNDDDRADIDLVRRFALALPEAGEEPHFDMTSFRVRGKIFATASSDGQSLHVFVDEPEALAYAAENPAAFAPLFWGRKLRGLRVALGAAPTDQVRELLAESWRRKAPASLIARVEWAGAGED